MKDATRKSEPTSTQTITCAAHRCSGERLGGEFRFTEMLPVLSHSAPDAPTSHRLNLVISTISGRSTFGGVATALRFFRRLSEYFQYLRIVVAHERPSDFEADAWDGWALDDGSVKTRSVIFLGDLKTSLPVGPSDIFLGTFWSTTAYIRGFMKTQSKFPQANSRFVYFIQDYEPGFYPCSAARSLAEESYSGDSDTIAVFNTQQLADYFRKIGKHFQRAYVFEPQLNPRLWKLRSALTGVEKERLVLLYGRAQIPRNGFNFAIEGLCAWADEFPDARQWTVLSVGERHSDIYIGNHVTVCSCGKLTMEEYGKLLSKAWLGIAFQFTAHPGYVSLEMAEFGVRVITNQFEGRDVSAMSAGIVALDTLRPQCIATTLSRFCREYSPRQTSAFPNPHSAFRGNENEFPFVQTLVHNWLADSK